MIDLFRQAEAQYERLNNEVMSGGISVEQFQQQLNQIRVTDAQGRVWMIQAGSGQWFVWQNGQWAPGQPYPSAPPPAPPPSPISAGAYIDRQYGGDPTMNYAASSGAPMPGQRGYQQGYQAGYPQQQLLPLEGGWGKVFTKMIGVAVAALVIFVLIGLAIDTFGDADFGEVWPGLLAAAALSMLISFFSMASQWRGRIVQFVVKREQDSSDDDSVSYHNVTYARLQLENGRTKDVRPARDWQVGDVIEKRRGEMGPKKL